MQQRLTLANGLRVNLSHDPQASRSAVLFHLSAGSHHEPQQWPGLAHLFEHVVFAGSRHYQGEQRLMSWAQAEGARLNATTLPTSTAWFFDISAAKLSEGFARLADMLAFPLLSLDAIRQETAVIDAEYHMLSADADTLCEAALAVALKSPKALADFHVGNLDSFGEDLPALQQALREYHQRFFHADNLTLWLSGPQSFKELAALAEQYGKIFPQSEKAPPPNVDALELQQNRAFSLKQSGHSRLHLSFKLKNATRQSLSLLRQFFSDEAEKSLLANLRSRGLCDSLNLLVPYSSEKGAIITFEFILNSPEQSSAAATEKLFFNWLRALSVLSSLETSTSQTGSLKINHYASLARKAFARLSPVDKLRAEAFGFPDITEQSSVLLQSWNALLTQLNIDNLTRLWISPGVNAEMIRVQGFELPVAPFDWVVDSHTKPPELDFYPLEKPVISLNLPMQKVNLPHQSQGLNEGVLILSPMLGHPLALRWVHILQASLRAIIGHCAHLGGTLSFENIQGQWLLQLSGSSPVLLSTLDAWVTCLNTLPEALIAQGERHYQQAQQTLQTDIAIRCLLNQLPRLLSGELFVKDTFTSLPRQPWQAGLYGGDDTLQDSVSRLLSAFPGEINTRKPPARPCHPAAATYTFPTTSNDSAVLLFCPLAEHTAACHAAWQILASLFEPRFFQRLRVEQNIGYVVTCRFMPSAGEYGMLFAVQSPSHSVEKIISEIRLFIGNMAEIIRNLPQTLFDEKCADLRNSLKINNPDPIEQARELWLSQYAYAPPIAEAISSLTLQQLLHACHQLAQDESRWWLLTN